MSQSGQEGTGQNDGAQDGQQGNTGTGTDSAQGTGNGGNASGADSEQQNSGKTDDSNNTVKRDDFEKIQRQLSEADRKRAAAEKELQDLKDKDLSETEKTKKDLQAVTSERDSLAEEVSKLRLANAFLSANNITWNNGDVALEVARSQGYLTDAISDKGEVDSKELTKALERLAKEHKYLVKAKGDSEEEEEETPASGAPASGAGKGKQSDTARIDRLKQTLPALGRR
jgi:hypothetical protein